VSEASSPKTLTVQVAASNASTQIAGVSSGGEGKALNAENQPQNCERTRDKVAISSQCPPISADSTSGTLDTLSDSRNNPSSPDLAIMAQFQKRIRCMEAASQKIMVQRLQEDWAECPDAQVYEVMENEKQWWFFIAVRALYRETRPQEISLEKPKNALQSGIRYGATRILSLHESYSTFIIQYFLSTITFQSKYLDLFSPEIKIY
jgi:hypothetical protein